MLLQRQEADGTNRVFSDQGEAGPLPSNAEADNLPKQLFDLPDADGGDSLRHGQQQSTSSEVNSPSAQQQQQQQHKLLKPINLSLQAEVASKLTPSEVQRVCRFVVRSVRSHALSLLCTPAKTHLEGMTSVALRFLLDQDPQFRNATSQVLEPEAGTLDEIVQQLSDVFGFPSSPSQLAVWVLSHPSLAYLPEGFSSHVDQGQISFPDSANTHIR